ncbi:signal peptidase I [[Clostridium] hylemonae]|uniref:Signal peptidase I n=1 Tax=[Clostridium] hylemonae DSM 15053 TaxID=553973 RepID=C0BWQ0_9FIRM|nr:signal peptidase I [[Clostridium] hylemonae]EEG75732.1 signal peptidase I [[Clostridium] hylemonae DSM 15053]
MRRRRKSLGFARKRRRIHINWEYLPVIGKWVFKIVVVCLLAFVYVWYFGQRVSTIGDSMNPVLENGDVVLVNRIVYNATSPKRGDIIAFKPKGNENAHYYIKRIVGLPGETVEIIENSVYINGKKIEEDYKTTDIDDVGIASEKITLGGDEYFVLGDNRENSEDSRNADVGNVKRKYIYGEVWFTISPRKNMGFTG